MKTTTTQPFAEDDPLEALVAECLARMSSSGEDPVDQMCLAHPEHAAALRERRSGLIKLGFWTSRNRDLRRIGRFELFRELGRGGMGIVYLAEELEPLRRLVAVKVIVGQAPPGILTRFEAERQTIASLVHPHIAQVLEAGTADDGQPWYAMEFVDGRPLNHFCDEHRLTIRQRLDVFLQVCDAVQFAHQKGVVHRDLKPGNILVCERGGRPVVKVIDFGLAKALQPDASTPNLTEVGQILGTPEYMSPEQALPTAAGVDTRADVYALGSVLYELCAGALPFDFRQLREKGFLVLQRAVCEQTPPKASARAHALGADAVTIAACRSTRPSMLVRRLDGDLDWIMQKALQKDRERRYPTVSELAADVRRHLDDQPVHAGPPSASYRLRKFVRRHRAGVAFGAVTALGLVVSLGIVSNLLAQRNQSLERFDTLQLLLDLEDLAGRAEAETWPALPSALEHIDGWLIAARQITDLLPRYRVQLATLEADGEQTADGWRFAAPRDRVLHTQLSELIALCERLTAEHGDVTTTAARRALATSLRDRSITVHAARWDEAIATIADRDACPYNGMTITPQVGFVPLGRDERSKLYEFAMLQDGLELPARVDGGWRICDDTCMVFVLIPAGDAHLGIDWPDARLPAALREPNKPHNTEYLEKKNVVGGHHVTVHLDAFLISKYEMTQAQWLHLMGENPSTWSPSNRPGITLTHPVGTVNAVTANKVARRLGLHVPTGAQWQYAARAGAESPWWTGFEIRDWHGHENIADASFAADGGVPEKGESDLTYDDQYTFTAPVDTMSQNAFGLHHVLGNVREWTSDPPHLYKDAMPRRRDGVLEPEQPLEPGQSMDTSHRYIMGGSFATDWLKCRSTLRTRVPVEQSSATFGVRFAAAL